MVSLLDLAIADVELRHVVGGGYASSPNGKPPYIVVRLHRRIADAGSLRLEPGAS